MSNYPATGPTTRFPPADQRDYAPSEPEWREDHTSIYPYQAATQRSRDNTLIAIVIAAAAVMWYMARAGAYSEYHAQPPAAVEPPPAITIVDNSWNWNMCGVCTDGNASPHFVIQQP